MAKVLKTHFEMLMWCGVGACTLRPKSGPYRDDTPSEAESRMRMGQSWKERKQGRSK